MNDVLFFDTEATTYQKGHPFSKPNRLMCVATLFDGTSTYFDIEHSGKPYGHNLQAIKEQFQQAKLIVGFNVKYDLHWLRRYISDLPIPRVWDCQLGEFILSAQRWRYPDLDTTLDRYNLPRKLSVVRTNYWDVGLDTDQVPPDILEEYVLGDIVSLPQVYAAQLAAMSPKQRVLCQLQCDDELTLQEMEFNGLLFAREQANTLAQETQGKIQTILDELTQLVGTTLVNWNSGDHCSAVLYGGGIRIPARETVLRTLKNGRIKPYERNCFRELAFQRRVNPLPRTEYEKTARFSEEQLSYENSKRRAERKPLLYRTWGTGEAVLRTLRPRSKSTKRIIELLLALADLEKLRSTYYEGIPKLYEEMQWADGLIHGQLSQCVAVTGRIASSKPNLQNFDNLIKPLFQSRYP